MIKFLLLFCVNNQRERGDLQPSIFTLFQMVKKDRGVQRQVSELNLKLVSLDSFTCYVARFNIVRSFPSQGAFQLAGCLGPRGSADGGGDHDPGLVP